MSFSTEPSPLQLPQFEAFEWNRFLHMKFNPRVSFWAAGIIWSFVIFTMARQKDAYEEFTRWSDWIGDEWSWLYIGSQDIWILVLIYLLCTKYGQVKLGKDDEAPEFSKFQWFSMLFAAGVGVGLFYYGVYESVWHYTDESTRWNALNDNERAQHALMITVFHWGVHGWIPYTTIGAILAVVGYRRGYPMTIRACFVPLLPDRVLRGLVGDVIDILSICATLFGVCTSLGLGVMQLNNAIVRLDKGTYHGTNARENGRFDITESKRTQIIIIWVVTLCATISVVTGVKGGILTLSLGTFAVGTFIVMSVLFMGDTILILNSITSVIGYYMWYLPKISWHTDAWETADDEGAPDGKGGSPSWMGAWTIFYWGWWIAFAPFVGTFIAKISRGRTLGEFIFWTLLIPTGYCIMWFGVLGSEGIRLERQAQKSGLTCENPFGPLQSTRLKRFGWEAKNQQAYEVRLSCLSTEGVLFDTLAAYGTRTFGYFTCGITALCLLFYFVTSSDSGSLVIDSLAANGDEEPPMLQRIFWALTEGATATALLDSGKTRALVSLRSVSIVSGLPYTFILCYLCYSLVLITKEEFGELSPTRSWLRTSLFLPDEHIAKDGIIMGVTRFVAYSICPWVPMKKNAAKIKALTFKDHVDTSSKMCDIGTCFASFLFYLTIALLAASPAEAALRKIAGLFYLSFCILVAGQRYQMRDAVNCTRGDIFTDYLAAVMMYPIVLAQCETELEFGTIPVVIGEKEELAIVKKDGLETKEGEPVAKVAATTQEDAVDAA